MYYIIKYKGVDNLLIWVPLMILEVMYLKEKQKREFIATLVWSQWFIWV